MSRDSMVTWCLWWHAPDSYCFLLLPVAGLNC